MNLTKILTIVLMTISLALGYYLYSGVQKVIDDRAIIATTEAEVIERLKLIREAEVLYQEQNGKYTASWDSLANFIDHGRVPILQRREEIKQKPYGGEEIIFHVDTLGFISAREKIFKKNYSMNVTENGIFEGYNVKVGDEVIKNQKAYFIRVGDRKNSPPFVEKGVIQSLANIKVGQAVTKGTTLINYSDYVFNKNTDVTRLGEVPNNPGVMFDIFVKKIDRNGLMVDVIEVRDPKPINPMRKESNEQKARKPLRFGSRTDVATAGNWE